jgi:hypothetical protein
MMSKAARVRKAMSRAMMPSSMARARIVGIVSWRPRALNRQT